MMKTRLISIPRRVSGKGSNAGLADLEKIGIHLLCGPPGKPHVNVTNTSVCLQWSKPEYQLNENFYPIQSYLVYAPLVNDPTTKLDAWPTSGEMLSVEITSLPQNAMLTFKVQAVTSIGHGVESKESNYIKLSSQGGGDPSFSSRYAAQSSRPRANTTSAAEGNTTETLTSDYLDELLIKLSRARWKWYEIGNKLGLKPEILNRIKDNNNNLTHFLRNMLIMWLDQGNATKKALCEALYAVGFRDRSSSLADGSLGHWKL